MLRTMCKQVDDVLAEHEYGEFLLNAAKLFQDLLCRTADALEREDRERDAKLREPSSVVYDPRGKGGTNGKNK
jgi:hypothetical protein